RRKRPRRAPLTVSTQQAQQLVGMGRLALRLQVFLLAVAQHHQLHRTAFMRAEKRVGAGLDRGDRRRLRKTPARAVGVDASDGFDLLQRIVAVGAIDGRNRALAERTGHDGYGVVRVIGLREPSTYSPFAPIATA